MVFEIPEDEKMSRMTFAEKQRVRARAFLAPGRYPTAVGTVLRRELLAGDEFGYRFGPAPVVAELVEHIMELAMHDAAGRSLPVGTAAPCRADSDRSGAALRGERPAARSARPVPRSS